MQVSTHYEDLLRQATGVEKLESHLDLLQTHMSALVASTERVRARVREPHKALAAQTGTLARLQVLKRARGAVRGILGCDQSMMLHAIFTFLVNSTVVCICPEKILEKRLKLE